MMDFIKWAVEVGWDSYVDVLEKMDRRVDSWFLMGSPFYVFMLISVYLSLVLGSGALWMRETGNNLNLYRLLVYYNSIVCGINIAIGIALSLLVSRAKYSYICQRVRFKSFDDNENLIAEWLWVYLLAKCLEMADTVFIVIRRKKANLGFLHIYHHATIIVVTWLAVRFLPGGMTAHFAIVNCWIHSAMYIYYKISTISKLNDYFSYKAFVTWAQVFQFSTAILIILNGIRDSCGYPKWALALLLIYLSSFVLMYLQFYWEEYYTSDTMSEATLAPEGKGSAEEQQLKQ